MKWRPGVAAVSRRRAPGHLDGDSATGAAVPPRAGIRICRADLERVIDKCLEKDRELRYQHASDMRADLQRLKRDTRIGARVDAARRSRAVGPSHAGR